MTDLILDLEEEKNGGGGGLSDGNIFYPDPLQSPIRQRQNALDLVKLAVDLVAWLWREHWRWVVLGFYLLALGVWVLLG